MAGAKFSPVLAAVVGALLVALTQARGHCHSGRYYSGLELARDQITPPAAFLPTLGLAECSQQQCRCRGRLPGPRRLVLTSPCLLLGVSGAMSRCPALHITAAGVTCHESRVTMSRCHDVPLVGLSLAWCRVLGVFAVLTRELGMGK